MKTLAGERGMYQTEAMFYRTYAKKLEGIIPRCYGAAISEDGQRFALLFEDMSPGRTGDRLAFSVEDARMAVDHAASFHAAFWRDPSLGEHDWLGSPERELEPALLAATMSLLSQAADECDARFGDVMPPAVTEAAREIANQYGTIQRYRARRQQTLIHGDYHPQQMFFPTELGGRFAVFDWQTAGTGLGAEDVARALVMGMSADERRAAEPGLLDRYHLALQQNGVAGYSRDEFDADYRVALYRNVVLMVVVCPRITEEQFAAGRARAEAMGVENPLGTAAAALAASLEDHDFLGALAELE